MLVDCHCHLDYPEFKQDIEEVVERAKDMVVVNSIIKPDYFEESMNLCERYENVYCSLGLSASDVDEDRFKQTKKLLRKNRGRIVGLGEVGLDHHWVKEEAEREVIRRYFIEFIGLSEQLDLPLIVHSRKAEEECINILGERKISAIMHCFSGTNELAKKALDQGCLISIPTNVTYVKKRQKLAKDVPLESMVLETDSPYLCPFREKRNEPSNIRFSAEKIADLKGVGISVVEDATTENALNFYGIKNV